MKTILVFIFLLGVAFAQISPSGNPQCSLIDNGDGTTSVDYNDPNCQNTLEYKNWKCSQFDIFSFDYAGCAIDGLLYPLYALMTGTIAWLINTVVSLMFYSPDLDMIKPRYENIRNIAQSIFSVLVALLGLYWIVGARSVEGRIKAKVWSERLIALIIIEAIGLYLYTMALGLNSYVAGEVLSEVSTDLFGTLGTSGATSVVMMLVAAYGTVSISLTVLTLVARQILLSALFVFFPITLLLYMTPPTKKWGSVALNLTLVIIFLGALDAIMLYGGSAVISMIDLGGLDVIIRPLIVYTVFGAIGTLNIYVAMMVPGLSGGMGSTTMISSGINNRTAPMRSGIRKDLKIRIMGEKKRSYKITDY